MAQVAIEQGIPADLARLLARQTVAGVRRAAGRQWGGCRCASPGGHQSGGHRGRAEGADGAGRVAGGLSRAIAAATVRSRELAG